MSPIGHSPRGPPAFLLGTNELVSTENAGPYRGKYPARMGATGGVAEAPASTLAQEKVPQYGIGYHRIGRGPASVQNHQLTGNASQVVRESARLVRWNWPLQLLASIGESIRYDLLSLWCNGDHALTNVPRHVRRAGSGKFVVNWDPLTNPRKGLAHAVAERIEIVSLLQRGPGNLQQQQQRVTATSLTALLQRDSGLNITKEQLSQHCQYPKMDLLLPHFHEIRHWKKHKADALKPFY
ncbi:uncharacterized protein Z520_09638 [Fonsecaea multimorphosa CBS 102226]|uniref:Uncharacterized protein n=1 Tax=Fonsecaea multimorphosa CBS 102226 TaxID=1442371 RepID=A0A0D2JMQ4_9EURO|nr:uncharacterized protein Z520_09638 [Fonsecaea multimorphosa CBS 102226]KIX94592.1 hypothetical protein Z520_09638 [Fonsecaea multimorphosa CBS 102226]